MKQVFAKIRRSLIALEIWDTFPLGQPAVNGAGIQSNRSARAKGAIDHQEQSKDDRHDARTLARLARIDPELWVRCGIAVRKRKSI